MPILSELLKENEFNNISEIGVKHGYFDFECFYKDKRIIVELKIGSGDYLKNILKGVTQAWSYCEDIKGDGILVLEYPAQIRTPLFLTPDIVQDLVLNTKVDAIFLSRFFNESFSSIKSSEIFLKLQTSIDGFLIQKETKSSFQLIIEALRSGIGIVAEILRKQMTNKEISELIDIVVGRFDLFLGFGQIEKSKESIENLKLAAVDLIPYLFTNQILFYRIFSETTDRVSKMDEKKITSIKDLKSYFKEITDINYKAIYSIDIASKLPDQEEIINEVKEIIKAIEILKPELVKHDLLGRLYHELLPFTTRKILAAFYTNPVAADILAGLTIEKYDDTIIDPACGSGTLLVAAYKRKLNCYKEKREINSFSDLEKLHREFVEEQITGLDIMPFASHLTAVNLAAQTPNAITNKVRVGCQDSLELQGRICGLVLHPIFIEKGISIEPFNVSVQPSFFGEGKILDSSGAIDPQGGKGENFLLKPVDVVLMNPPFSDREKMPSDYREYLKTFQELITKCGNQVNFWGFFIALADALLKENGKLGLVIPINIARGEATQKIRNYILENYHIQYILKTTKEIAFSEGSAFKDILVIAEKRKSKAEDLTGIIFFKKSIKEMQLEDVKQLLEKIESISIKRKEYIDEELETYWVSQREFLNKKSNLMPFLWAINIRNMKIVNEFLDLVQKRSGQKLSKIESSAIEEGFHASPMGLTELTFITKPLDKSRIQRNVLMLLERESEDSIFVKLNPIKKVFEIPREKIIPALKTLTGMKTFDLDKNHDYIITKDFPEFKEIKILSKWKKEFSWKIINNNVKNKLVNLVVARRFNIYSPNTHHLAFYSEQLFVAPHTFKIIKTHSSDEAKIICLSFNSILNLCQLFTLKEQTAGSYTDIMESDLILFSIINDKSLLESERKTLINLFEELKDIEFPSFIEQLENRFPARVRLDKTILRILGFSEEEIDKWLPTVYNCLLEELKVNKKD